MKWLLRIFGYYKYQTNIGYDIINYLSEKTGDIGLDGYDDQEEIAEHIQWMIKGSCK